MIKEMGDMIPAGSLIVPSTKSRRIIQISEVAFSKNISITKIYMYGNYTFDNVYLQVVDEVEYVLG